VTVAHTGWLTGFTIALSFIGVVALPVGIILIIVGLVRYFFPGQESAEAVLDRRYAAGEISRSEYEELRRDLGLPPRRDPHDRS
jgi:uncharacterized membrane protein